MASMPRRIATRLAGGCALLLGISLSGCAAPQFTGVFDPDANIRFEVPNGWHQISGPSLASELKGSGAAWMVAYQAGPKPKAADWLSFDTAQPFVYAQSGPLSSTLHRAMSDQLLRDFMLPVTFMARQNAVAQGLPFTDFWLIRDQILTLSQGVHGVRDTFDYTLPGAVTFAGDETDTFDIDTLTNAGQTDVFILVVHCTAACYNNYRTEIEHMMSSIGVPGSGPPKPLWPGLRGR